MRAAPPVLTTAVLWAPRAEAKSALGSAFSLIGFSSDLYSFWSWSGSVATGGRAQVEANYLHVQNAIMYGAGSDASLAQSIRAASGGLMAQYGMEGIQIGAKLAPGYADVRYQLGLLFSEVGRTADAEAELRASLDVQPSYVLARLALGVLLETLGRNAEALALLQEVRQAGLVSNDLQEHLTTLEERCAR